MTRLARGDVEMGAGIVATNGAAIAVRLRDCGPCSTTGSASWSGRDGRMPRPAGDGCAARLDGARRAARAPGRADAMTDELVLVVPTRSSIAGLGGWHGLSDGRPRRRSVAAIDPRRGRFEPRPRWRPTRRSSRSSRTWSSATATRWFLMRRTRAGGDARLHDRWSIGVGGHLNPGDGGLDGGLPRGEWSRGARRRLRARVPLRRAAQRRHDRRSARSTSARSTWPTPPAGRSRSARRQAQRRVRRAGRGRGGRDRTSRPGAGSCSSISRRGPRLRSPAAEVAS